MLAERLACLPVYLLGLELLSDGSNMLLILRMNVLLLLSAKM